MDVAQALQEAQTTTITEAEVTAKNPIPFAAPRQVDLSALPIEKRKSGFDTYSGQGMPSLTEEGPFARQGVNPELVVQMEVKINPDVKGQEHTCPDSLLPVQKDTNCIEICE
jgi:hypothetical protein